jgi:hypothetical protein
MTKLRLGTRQKHADIENSGGVQMLFNTELLIEGAQMVHSLQLWGLDGVDPVTASCLSDLLNDFRSVATVGAGAARGFGNIAFDGYEPGPDAPPLPSPSLYLDYVAAHRDEMVAWVMSKGEPRELPSAKKGSKKRQPESAEAIL